MGRNKGVEPLHNRATIYRVNHFTNSAIRHYYTTKKKGIWQALLLN